MKKLLLLLLMPFMMNAQSPGSAESKQVAKDSLESYRKQILRGKSFSTMARLYSEDPGSAKEGGLYQKIKRGVMVPEFENIAFSIKPGDVSEVFETQYGFHILQVAEKRTDEVDVRHILIVPK